jgi:hypothetical protein
MQVFKLGKCFYCKSNVPFNTTICVICEKPIMPQLQPQASIKLQVFDFIWLNSFLMSNNFFKREKLFVLYVQQGIHQIIQHA